MYIAYIILRLKIETHNTMVKKLLFVGVLLSLFIFSCNNTSQNDGNDGLDTLGVNPELQAEVSSEMIQMVISSVPNPVTMSTLLHQSGVVYSSDLLNPIENIDKYSTNYKKALNLGTYGTDLVHMNIYDRTVSTVLYLKNLKDLANDLSLGQFFDYETLNRLSENNKNVDSVLLITSSGFDRMTNFLIEQDRSPIGILLSYGIWIESMHLATNIDKVTNKTAVHERIGEQMEVLDNIMILLGVYKHRAEFKELFDDAEDLQKVYDSVTIDYHYKEPTTKVVDGMLVIEDNSESVINISEETVENIKKQIQVIRNKLIN